MFRETDTNTQLSLFEDPVDFMGRRAAKKFDDPKSRSFGLSRRATLSES